MTKQQCIDEMKVLLDIVATRPMLMREVAPLTRRISELCDALDTFARAEI